MNRISFYAIITVLVALDSLLLTSPNLLGKIGLIIYKYQYLRTFPRILLTVGLVVTIAILISELIRVLVRKRKLGRGKGIALLLFMICASAGIVHKTALDFSKWAYSHTGMRFKYGAYLLPTLVMVTFAYALVTLPKKQQPRSA